MERDDIEGAKAAAQYFLELYPYVYSTGDLSAWLEIAHPDCEFCAGVAENVEDLHGDGGYADGPAIEFVKVDAQAPTSDNEYFAVRVEAIEHPSSRFDGSGTVLGSQDGGPIDADIALQRTTAGQWSIRGAVVTPREAEG